MVLKAIQATGLFVCPRGQPSSSRLQKARAKVDMSLMLASQPVRSIFYRRMR